MLRFLMKQMSSNHIKSSFFSENCLINSLLDDKNSLRIWNPNFSPKKLSSRSDEMVSGERAGERAMLPMSKKNLGIQWDPDPDRSSLSVLVPQKFCVGSFLLGSAEPLGICQAVPSQNGGAETGRHARPQHSEKERCDLSSTAAEFLVEVQLSYFLGVLRAD